MAKERIHLTESQLYRIIENQVREAIEDEGLWNQVKQGAKSAFGNGYGNNNGNDRHNGNGGFNFKKRWNAAKQGFQSQGEIDKIDDVINYLTPLVQSGKIDGNQTVAELIRTSGKFGKGNLNTMKNRQKSLASKAQNDIYR
jgi:hypothetical protein